MKILGLALFGLAATSLWLLLGWISGGLATLPDMSPVVPEADGIHPVVASETYHSGYEIGGGVPQKYPPAAAFIMGLAIEISDPDFYDDASVLLHLEEDEQRTGLWRLKDRLAPLIAISRFATQLAMGIAMGLLAMLAAQTCWSMGISRPLSIAAGVICIVTFGASYPVLYHGSTTNVDAYALAPSLAMLLFALRRNWWCAAAAAGLAAAAKDPSYVAGFVLVGFAVLDAERGRARRFLGISAVGLLVYLASAGALTGPGVWWEHMQYLFQGGVSSVPRIDPAEPGQWGQLIAYSARLIWASQGPITCVAGVAGLVAIGLRSPRTALLLFAAIASVWVLFILPVRFVYLRFLLLPSAVLSVGAAALVAMLCSRGLVRLKRPRLEALAALLIAGLWWFAQHRDLVFGGPPPNASRFYAREILQGAEPRLEAARAISELASPGDRIVLIADQRRQGPPLDPVRFSVQELGLDKAAPTFADWQAAPAESRPEWVLLMSSPVNQPNGGSPSQFKLPVPGSRVRGLYEVIQNFGEPTGHVVERSISIRPAISLMRRL